ncbi:hypothetical protein BV22DRAFT_1035560 [Leucogyrophana mollusca]|uniref:Uncharacterized protein n=1 Tax=Leucogyrophana mollusca TaxID=85980 RepID=A0ACB8BEG7_9AGAM|nr:hypothetical protein BV22DRAFT_1035560 [Leucogyrophana mollusca]
MASFSSLTTLIQIADLYFDDGNIVVFVDRDLEATAVFRLHKSILASQSAVFADLFSLPAPSKDTVESNEMYDGVPVVRMHDNAKDIEGLFRALYCPSSILFKRRHPDTPLKVKGLLALTTKYQVDRLRETIISQVRADWPSSIFEWDVLEEEAGQLQDEILQEALQNGLEPWQSRAADDYLPEPASAIRLAYEASIPEIIPAAFYQLSRTEPSQDYDRWRALSNDDPFHEAHCDWIDGARTARWSMLVQEDLLSLARGKEKLQRFAEEIHRSMLPVVTCCRMGCLDVWKDVPQPVRKDLLRDLKEFCSETRYPGKGMCGACRQEINRRAKRLRGDLWGRLGEFFGEE